MKNSSLVDPTPQLPADIRTGDRHIDRYLEQINQHLVGSRSIRRNVLNEARDFVLDASACPGDRDAAIRSAINEFGTPEEIGREQRKERWHLFLKLSLLTGPIFAVLMLAISLLQSNPSDYKWGVLISVFLFNMLLFGLAMGAIFAYVMGGTASSSTSLETATGQAGFVVAYRKFSRTLCWALIGVFGTMQVILLLALFNADPTGIFNGWPWPALAFMVFINIKNVGAPLHALRFKAETGPDTLVIHRLSGPLHLQRNQIISVTKPGFFRQAFSTLYGNQYRISWRTEDGRKVRNFRLSLTYDITNGDRLLVWLESAARDSNT